MNFTLYEEYRHNCSHITLSAMLTRIGIDVHLLFNQAGLYFKSTEDTIILTPYYQDFLIYVEKYFDTQLINMEFCSFNDFSDSIKHTLKKGYTVAIRVDAYYLDFSNTFHENHSMHFLEVLDYDANSFVIADHFFKCHTRMNDSQLLDIINLSIGESIDKRYYYYFFKKTGNNNGANQPDVIDTIKNNYFVMKGNRLWYKDDPYMGKIGFDALLELENTFSNLDLQKSSQENSLILYNGIKEVSNSRHHTGVYLRKSSFFPLAELYDSLQQDWMVLSNLFLKGTIEGFVKNKARLLKRLDIIKQKENKVIEFIETNYVQI